MVALTQKIFSAHYAWFPRGGSHIRIIVLFMTFTKNSELVFSFDTNFPVAHTVYRIPVVSFQQFWLPSPGHDTC